MSQRISERVTELTGARTPFVHATVVRAQPPTSVQPGDSAIVLPDGSVEGFVGGQCTQNSVRTAALAALAGGAATLLRVVPDGTAEFPATPGAQVVVNPCLSGGAVEIFLQPVLPPPVIAVTGSTPIADALRATAAFLGYTVAPDPGGSGAEPVRTTDDLSGCDAVLLSSHGPGEAETIRAALDAGVGHIALVASRKRGAAVLDELGLSEAERARVHSPAGLWIGARTAPEIALSIMAEVVAAVHGIRPETGPAPADPAAAEQVATGGPAPAASSRPNPSVTPRQAVDPVCGMTVTVMADTPHLRIDGEDVYFCNPGCRKRYAALHAAAE